MYHTYCWGVLLISLTGICAFIILTVGLCSNQWLVSGPLLCFLLEFCSSHWLVSGPLLLLLLEFCFSHWLVSEPFQYLPLGVLLKSLIGIWTFIMLTVGVLLKSLTSIWFFIILTVGVCAQFTDWHLNLYYAYCWSSAQITYKYLVLYYTYCWMFCSNHWLVSGSLLFLLLGVLLISLTGIWFFIIFTVGGSAHITDWYLVLYYTYCWGFYSSHWLVYGSLLYLLLEFYSSHWQVSWPLLYLLLECFSNHVLVFGPSFRLKLCSYIALDYWFLLNKQNQVKKIILFALSICNRPFAHFRLWCINFKYVLHELFPFKTVKSVPFMQSSIN